MEDDRQRDQAAIETWAKTWVAGAQFGTPVPALTEFQSAMQSRAPRLGLMPDVPPPTSPMQPATGVQQQPPQGPGGPPKPPGPPLGQQPQQPMMPPVRPAMPAPMPDPATAMAVQRGLAGQGLPTAYGQIANRAMASQLMGMGGPRLPMPPGTQPGYNG